MSKPLLADSVNGGSERPSFRSMLLVALVMLPFGLGTTSGQEEASQPSASGRFVAGRSRDAIEELPWRIESVAPNTLPAIDLPGSGGIGSGVLMLDRGAWPERLSLRLPLRGLEAFELRVGNRRWSISVDSGDGTVRSTYRSERDAAGRYGDEMPLDEQDPERLTVRFEPSRHEVLQRETREREGGDQRTPEEQASGFRGVVVEVPAARLAGERREIEIRWVDFFR
ncbi:MAG TPA: hypothetical protein PLI18_08135 [Pirellulaceae bacterium]|nr:hypothetical protein [Pirellulaceae bacterium]